MTKKGMPRGRCVAVVISSPGLARARGSKWRLRGYAAPGAFQLTHFDCVARLRQQIIQGRALSERRALHP